LVVWCSLVGPAQARENASCSSRGLEVPRDDTVQEIRLGDGSRLYGKVVEVIEERVVFETLSGHRLSLECGEVRKLRTVRGQVSEGDFRPEDPNRTRLFFGPTARSLPKGRGYLGVYELVMPFLQVGVTDRITVGGGTPFIYFGEASSHPFWFTPKVQLVRGESTQLAAGVLHFVFTGDDEPVGIAYGVATHGTADASVTAGVGFGYETSDRGTWIGMIGGELRVGRGIKLLAEGYTWQEGETILMGGIRLFGARLSADLGLVTALDSDDAFVFPVVNVVWTF
jgi:hypothetical protein